MRGIFVGCWASAETQSAKSSAKSKGRYFFFMFFPVSIHSTLDT